MNIYLHELRAYRKNTILWIVSLSAGTAFLFSMYPAFAGNTASLTDVLKNYPAIVQAAFGIAIDKIGSVSGFFSFIATFLSICGAVQAMTLGLSVLSKENTGKTADFLLTKPVSRSRIVLSKLLAVLTCVVLTSALTIAAASGMAFAVSAEPFDYTPFLLISLTFFFIQLMFLALGFAASAIAAKIRSVIPIALASSFGLFVVGAVAATLNQQALYYLSPFKYFDTVKILTTSSYDASFMLVGALLVAAAIAAGFTVYTRRDIHTA